MPDRNKMTITLREVWSLHHSRKIDELTEQLLYAVTFAEQEKLREQIESHERALASLEREPS